MPSGLLQLWGVNNPVYNRRTGLGGVVDCDAGYSRSPAVAAALAKALRESDEEFFGHDYCINNHVYTTLLKQLSERKILK